MIHIKTHHRGCQGNWAFCLHEETCQYIFTATINNSFWGFVSSCVSVYFYSVESCLEEKHSVDCVGKWLKIMIMAQKDNLG